MSAPAVRRLRNVFVTGAGAFLPGEPVDNDAIDRFIAPLNAASSRIKRRILAENGIRTRHYAIDEEGRTRHSAAAMAAAAVRECLGPHALEDVSLLCTASSGGDLVLPGLANMVQGELAAPPMQTASFHGVCAASMAALHHAALCVESGEHAQAVVVAAEVPSRLFKRSRFAPVGYDADFDAHFLRWMLSDGAGAVRLAASPAGEVALRLDWVALKSFSGDYPVCMQMGMNGDPSRTWPDYPSFSEAEAAGAMLLRQDIRLLPHLFDLAIHEYAALVGLGLVRSDQIDHFLCHYSSERFAPVVAECLDRARLTIPRVRWYTNLARRGNTGSASILIMLRDFLAERAPKPGERILLFVPESGRFTVAFALLEVVAGERARSATTPRARTQSPAAGPAAATGATAGEAATPDEGGSTSQNLPSAPHDPTSATDPAVAALLRDLAAVWHAYRSQAWRTPLVRSIVERRFRREHYLRWMACWIPQVREGAFWMRAAVANLGPRFAGLGAIIERHAGEEQYDFRILFEDYRRAGGEAESIESLRRNPGGEALNAYLHARAAEPDAVGLLGAIYVIEGTGNRIIPALLPLIRSQLPLPAGTFRFLQYHGENDVNHLRRWLDAVAMTLAIDPAAGADIVATASHTARLYLMQMEMAA